MVPILTFICIIIRIIIWIIIRIFFVIIIWPFLSHWIIVWIIWNPGVGIGRPGPAREFSARNFPKLSPRTFSPSPVCPPISSPSPKPAPENRAQPGRAPGRPALCRPLIWIIIIWRFLSSWIVIWIIS